MDILKFLNYVLSHSII